MFPDAYLNATVKLMVVGQQTNGWGHPDDEIEGLLVEYRRFDLGKNIRQFALLAGGSCGLCKPESRWAATGIPLVESGQSRCRSEEAFFCDRRVGLIRRPSPGRTRHHELWEAWVVSLYVLLAKDEAMKVIDGDDF